MCYKSPKDVDNNLMKQLQSFMIKNGSRGMQDLRVGLQRREAGVGSVETHYLR